jgi:SAM-dependent methyltransferase
MTHILQNKNYYAGYDWSRGGAEWSHYWGCADSMWNASIYPRIASFLPAATIVEIGAGHGRISKILHRYMQEKLILTDFNEQCVEACNREFETDARVSCLLSDGSSLQGIADNSVDLVVSFYSLVDADVDVIRAYTKEFDRVLKKDGVVFLHHSNAAAYYDAAVIQQNKCMQLLAQYRDITMSATIMQQLAANSGLIVIQQECINWDISEVLSDCFTIMTRPNSRWASRSVISDNPGFQEEMRSARYGYKETGSYQ